MTVILDSCDDELRYLDVECKVYDNCLDLSGMFGVDNEIDLGIFKLLHLNIRSYNKNVDELLVYLDAIKVKFDFIVLTEAWLSEGFYGVDLDGYSLVWTTNWKTRNDGVVVYINKSLSAVTREVTIGDVYGLSIDFTVHTRLFNLLALYRTHESRFDFFVMHWQITMKII